MSDRITNLMAADTFFSKPRNHRAQYWIEQERYTMSVVQARKKLKKPAQKVRKPSTSAIDFTEQQLAIALRVLERKETNNE